MFLHSYNQLDFLWHSKPIGRLSYNQASRIVMPRTENIVNFRLKKNKLEKNSPAAETPPLGTQ